MHLLQARRAINEGTQLGNKVKEIIERGDLVDDATMLDLVTDILKKMDNQVKPFIQVA